MKLKLTDEQMNQMLKLPEQGMGYHVVDIKLKNGTVLSERIILDSRYVQLNQDEKISAFDIETIQLHQL
ncbi:MAG: hypothetical protein ABI763_13695 [Bacteroidota bacterium]